MTSQVTICGGGNAAHTLAGILGSHTNLVVQVYAPYSDEAAKWQEGIQSRGGIAVDTPSGMMVGRPERVSAEAAAVVPGSRMIILALPAFAHESTLADIAPHLDPGAWVGAMPARGGFDLGAHRALANQALHVTLFGFQTLPWACRIQTYGQEALVLGTKEQVDIAAWPAEQAPLVAKEFEYLLGVPTNPASGFLSLTLADVGQIIHPGIMYGLFHKWDGSPYSRPPLFYQGVDSETTAVLQEMSAEIQGLREFFEVQFSGFDLSAVHTLEEWLRRSYQLAIADDSTLLACFHTNRSYAGLTAPVQQTANGFIPDFSARYLSEDVPFGLLVTRGIAEIAGVSTPTIDQVLYWAQDRLNQKYLVDGHLNPAALQSTRTPQRFGLTYLEQLLDVKPIRQWSSLSRTQCSASNTNQQPWEEITDES